MESRLEWWAYMLMILCIFFLCLLLNFVVKKINEVRLKEKFLRLQEKTSRNCCTQVQEEPVPTESTDVEHNEQVPRIAPKAASLVYNKEDNLNNAHGKSNANLPRESDSASQSKIDAANSKLNFLGTIYTDCLPSKVGEKLEPMQICDNDNGNIFKEVMERKAAGIYENNPTN